MPKEYICELVESPILNCNTRMTKSGWKILCKKIFKNEGNIRGNVTWNRLGKHGAAYHTCDECKLGKKLWIDGKDLYPSNIDWIEL